MRKRPDCYAHCGPGRRPKFAAFDFETRGLGGDVCAISYMMEGESEASYLSGGKPQDLVQKFFDIMCENYDFQWFAHNAQYEFRYFINGLIDHKENVTFYCRTDNDVFMITIKLSSDDEKAMLVMRDSLCIFPDTLRRFTEQFCPELPKLNIDFNVEEFNPRNPKHIEYSKRDSESLLKALTRFNDLLKSEFDVNIKSTIASTALSAWQRTLNADDKYYNDKGNEEFVRSAYYGGLVFLTDTQRVENAQTFDRNSSYPAEMMSQKFPLGNSARTTLWQGSKLGIYRVTVKAPDDLIVPILPKRDTKGIVWPAGIFETTVTSVELEFAVKHGYRLLHIHDGRIWYDTCSPFRDFVNKCRKIRMRHKGEAVEIVAKLMQNSLYGKFGSKRTRRKIYAHLQENEFDGAVPWGDHFFIKEEKADDMQCLPQWAVFVTAYARIRLLEKIYEIGPINVLYGDTDSLTLRPGYTLEESTEYGGWKKEKTWHSFRARGPKVYAGQIEMKNGDIELSGAAKGIPKKMWKSSDVFQSILKGKDKVVLYKTLEKFVMSLKTRYTGEHEAHRAISSLGHSRSWYRRPDGSVRPRTWQEIESCKADQGCEKRNRSALG